MRFHHEFDVGVALDTVYDALLDIERVAPCLPGAEVLARTGADAFSVAVKVRVGAASLQYRGDVQVLERDDQARRAVLSIKARETRGQGAAEATAEMRLAAGDAATRVGLDTEVNLTGKAATMGQGIIAAVSERLVGQFAQNLSSMLAPADPRPRGPMVG